jgi:predicted component of type VI protein secretion system
MRIIENSVALQGFFDMYANRWLIILKYSNERKLRYYVVYRWNYRDE